MVDLYGRESDESDVLIVPYITALALVQQQKASSETKYSQLLLLAVGMMDGW